MTYIAAVLFGIMVGLVGAVPVIGVVLWAAAAMSGRYAPPEEPYG